MTAPPIAEATPPMGLTTAESLLLVVGLILTIGVAAFLLTFFIGQARRESKQADS